MLSAARPRLRGNIPTGRNLVFLLTIGACFGFILSNYLHTIFPPLCSCPQSQSQDLSKFHKLGTVGVGVGEEGVGPEQKTTHDLNKTAAVAVRVLCCVLLTRPPNRERVEAVKDTWGKRCDKLIFLSSKNDRNAALGVVGLELEKREGGRNWFWLRGNGKEAMKYIWKHHKDDADWFLKADDDTYVILQNLRHFLADKDSNYPIYYGHRFNVTGTAKAKAKQGYMSAGGPGRVYVMSREATRRFVEVALPNPELCRSNITGLKDAEELVLIMLAWRRVTVGTV